jgi:hypothetical protein
MTGFCTHLEFSIVHFRLSEHFEKSPVKGHAAGHRPGLDAREPIPDHLRRSAGLPLAAQARLRGLANLVGQLGGCMYVRVGEGG